MTNEQLGIFLKNTYEILNQAIIEVDKKLPDDIERTKYTGFGSELIEQNRPFADVLKGLKSKINDIDRQVGILLNPINTIT